MPLVRVQVRNEYGLGLSQLYGEANREDPKAVLDGVAVAGLVGILRQLGDLAEFAAEVFHELQEQVMNTASRSHKITVRVEKIELSLPQIEKAALTQTNHIHLAYASGSDWHPRIRNTRNHFIYNDLPRFIMDNYEECRGPPHLSLLDRFDTGGPGSCLKRYTDPTFFKRVSSNYIEEQVRKDKKTSKRKKRRSLQRNGDISYGMPVCDARSRMHFVSHNIKGKTSPQIAVTFDMTLKSELGNKSKCFDSKKGTFLTDCVSHASPTLPTEEEEESIELPSSMLNMQPDLGNELSFDSKKGPVFEDCVSLTSPTLLPEEAKSIDLSSSGLKMQPELGDKSSCFDSRNGSIFEDRVSHSNSTLSPEMKEFIALPSSGLKIQHCFNPMHTEGEETSDLPSSIKVHQTDNPSSDFLNELNPIVGTCISRHEKTEILEPNGHLYNTDNSVDMLSIDYYLEAEEGSSIENAIILDNFYDAEYIKMEIVDCQVQPHDACLSEEKLSISSDSVTETRNFDSTLIRVDIPNDSEYLKKNVSVSCDDQFEDVESESDNYMDALNTLDSESESDPDYHTKGKVKQFSPDFSDCEEQSLNHQTADLEYPITSCSSLNPELPLLLLKSAHEDSSEFVETLVPDISSVSCDNVDSPVVKHENNNSKLSSPRSTDIFTLSLDGDKPLSGCLNIGSCENNQDHFDHSKFGTHSVCSSSANFISVFPSLESLLSSFLDVDVCENNPGYPDHSKLETFSNSPSFSCPEIPISPHPSVEMVSTVSPGVNVSENADFFNDSSFESACSDPSSSSSTISTFVPSDDDVSSSSPVKFLENDVISGYSSFVSVCGDPSICSSVPCHENIPSSSPVGTSEDICISGYSNLKVVSVDPSSSSCTICSSVPSDENITSSSLLVDYYEDDAFFGYSNVELVCGNPSSSSSTIISSVPSDGNILNSSPAVCIPGESGISGNSNFELFCCNPSTSSSTICCSVQSHENIPGSSPVDIFQNTGTDSLNFNSVCGDPPSSSSTICSSVPCYENISGTSPINISEDAGISGYSNLELVCGDLSSSNSTISCSLPSDENMSCDSTVVHISGNVCISGQSNMELVCSNLSSSSSTICSSMQNHDNIPGSSPVVDIFENTDISGYSNFELVCGDPSSSSSTICTSVQCDENISSSSPLDNLTEDDDILGQSNIEMVCGDTSSSSSTIISSVTSGGNILSRSPAVNISEESSISGYSNFDLICCNPSSSSSTICCSVQSHGIILSSSSVDIPQNTGTGSLNFKSICGDPPSSSSTICSFAPSYENASSCSPVDISEDAGISGYSNFVFVSSDLSSSNSTISCFVPSDEKISCGSPVVDIPENACISGCSNPELVCGNLSSSNSTFPFSLPSDENIPCGSPVGIFENACISGYSNPELVCGDLSSSNSTFLCSQLSDENISCGSPVGIFENLCISGYSNLELVCANPPSSGSTICSSMESHDSISSSSSVHVSENTDISGYSNFKLVCGDPSSSSSTICTSVQSDENISSSSPFVNLSEGDGIFGYSDIELVCGDPSSSCSATCCSMQSDGNIPSGLPVDISANSCISDPPIFKSICGDPSSSSSTICSSVPGDVCVSRSSSAVDISKSAGYSNFELVSGNTSSSISAVFRSVCSDENISCNSSVVDIFEITGISGYSNSNLVCGDDPSSSTTSTICSSLPSEENILNCLPIVNISEHVGISGHSNIDSVCSNPSSSFSTFCASMPCGENILSTSPFADICESTAISGFSSSQSAYSDPSSSTTSSDYELVGACSSPSTIFTFECENRDNMLIAGACESEKTVECFAAVDSIKIWTNGGLLGLEPSKPPDFGAINPTSEESVEKITNPDIISSACNGKLEGNGCLVMAEAESSDAPDVKTTSTVENDGNLFNVFGLKINTNGFRRTRSLVSDPGNEHTILRNKDGHGDLGDIPSSPPLEPMQINFKTANIAFEKSRLKLKFLDRNECHESIPDVFHSFQLISEPVSLPHDIVSNSNDDAFCMPSCPYYLSDVYSKSDYELWESCEQIDGEQIPCIGNVIPSFAQESEIDLFGCAPSPPPLTPLRWCGMNSHSDESNSDLKTVESNVCDHADIAEEASVFTQKREADAVEAAKDVGIDDRKIFLEQIKLKSFNLRRGATERTRFMTSGPTTPGKVTAILEKANAIRQAVGSDDGEEDEEDKWSDT